MTSFGRLFSRIRRKKENTKNYKKVEKRVYPELTKLQKLLDELYELTLSGLCSNDVFLEHQSSVTSIWNTYYSIARNSADNPGQSYRDLKDLEDGDLKKNILSVGKVIGPLVGMDVELINYKFIDLADKFKTVFDELKNLENSVEFKPDGPLPRTLKGVNKRIIREVERHRDVVKDRMEGLGEIESKWKVNKLLLDKASDPVDVRSLSRTSNKLASEHKDKLKKVTKEFNKIIKFCQKEIKQTATTISNQIEISLEIDGEPVYLDKRSMPGFDEIVVEDDPTGAKKKKKQEELIAKVSAKIESGKLLKDKILDPDLDDEDFENFLRENPPNRKDVADLMWYFKTLAEKTAGEPYEKGALTLPDPKNRLRKYLDQSGKTYVRGSSHISDLHNSTKSHDPRGIDFYDGNIDNPDLLLPFGMNTALIQSFKMPKSDDSLYIKMETESSRMSPGQTTAATAVGVILGLGPGIAGGIIGGLGGLIYGVFNDGPLKGAKKGAMEGAKMGGIVPFKVGLYGTHGLEAIYSNLTLKTRDDGFTPRPITKRDLIDSGEHALNLFHSVSGNQKDGLGTFREKMFKGTLATVHDKFKKRKHPVYLAYVELINSVKDNEKLKPLADILKTGKWKDNVGVMVDNCLTIDRGAEEIIKFHQNSKRGPSPSPYLSEDDILDLGKAAQAFQNFCETLSFEFGITDLRSEGAASRIGGEVVLTSGSLGMTVISDFTDEGEADAHILQLRRLKNLLIAKTNDSSEYLNDLSFCKNRIKTTQKYVQLLFDEDALDGDERVPLEEEILEDTHDKTIDIEDIAIGRFELLDDIVDNLMGEESAKAFKSITAQPYPKVELITDPDEKRDFVKERNEIIDVCNDCVSKIQAFWAVSKKLLTEIKSRAYLIRAQMADEAKKRFELDFNLGPTETVDDLKDGYEDLQDDVSSVILPMEEGFDKLAEGAQIHVNLNLELPAPKDRDPTRDRTAKIYSRVNDSLKTLVMYQDMVKLHNQRVSTIPESVARNPAVLMVCQSYQTEIEKNSNMINKFVKRFGPLEAQLQDLMIALG